MGKIKDETGKVYGELTVIRQVGIKNHLATWLCQCTCGNTIIVAGAHLRSGNTKSCGCQKYRGLNGGRSTAFY